MQTINEYMRRNKLGLKDVESYSDFICVQCNMILHDCKITTCGVKLCAGCVESYYLGSDKCPNCKRLLTLECKTEEFIDLDKEISELVITCPNLLCNITLSISEMSNHVNGCNGKNTERLFYSNCELDRRFNSLMLKLDEYDADKTGRICQLDKEILLLKTKNHELERKLESQNKEMKKLKLKMDPSMTMNSSNNQNTINISMDSAKRTILFGKRENNSDEFSVNDYNFLIQFYYYSAGDIDFYVKLIPGNKDDYLQWPLEKTMKLLLYSDRGYLIDISSSTATFSYATAAQSSKPLFHKPKYENKSIPESKITILDRSVLRNGNVSLLLMMLN